MKKVIEYIRPRIVKIVCPRTNSKGTGFLISKSGHIATNFHVVGDINQNGRVNYADEILISNKALREMKASIVHDIKSTASVLHDYSILKIDKEDAAFFKLGKTDDIEEGSKVYFGGFPLTQDSLTSHQGYISSIREAPTRFGTDLQKVFDVDGTVVGGNSGGPLIIRTSNSYEVVGIISQQVAYLTEAFEKLEQYLKVQMTNPSGGAVFVSGVNPNAALFETINILKANMSTGIGTAIFIDYAKQEFKSITKKT